MTDRAFARDGTFLPAPPHEPAVLEEAWRRGDADHGARHRAGGVRRILTHLAQRGTEARRAVGGGG